jgi:hypothetical protein
MKTSGIIILIISVLLCGVGACLLAGAGGLFQLDANRRSSWVPVTGTVTRMRTSTTTNSSGNTSNVYCPTVAYTTTDGQEREVDINECSFPPAFKTGDPVELLYNPADSGQVELKNGVGRAFTVGGLGALGVTGLACILPSALGIIIGAYLLIRARKPAAPTAM